MVKASIVRLGPSDDESVSSKLLRTAMVSYFETNAPSATSTIDNKSGATITISNKYFSANVLLEDIGGPALDDSKEDGVILVFDALRSNPDLSPEGFTGVSFDSLPTAHKTAEEKHLSGDLLRLCVGVSLTSLSPEELRGKNHEKEYARRIMWCLDNGYEYVEADLSEEGQAKGHQDRDKEGFARIVEAIQGAVWSSAVMAKAKTQELKNSYNQDSAALQSETKANDETERENPYEPPDPKKFGIVLENKQETKEAQNGADSIVDEILDPEKVGPDEMSKLRKDLEAEKVFDKMEAVLKEANRIREASVKGDLTDEERRARAGDAAMALVNLMGDMGFDDDDSEADDSVDSGIVDD